MRKLTITGIATLVAAAAFASTAGAELTKPGPGFLGPPVPAPVTSKPSLTSPIKVSPPPSTPTLTSGTSIRVPAF